nr:MAG TPA: hypothetical protein [Caudoviricetes sp.]
MKVRMKDDNKLKPKYFILMFIRLGTPFTIERKICFVLVLQ